MRTARDGISMKEESWLRPFWFQCRERALTWGSCYQQAWKLRAEITFTSKVAIRKYFHHIFIKIHCMYTCTICSKTSFIILFLSRHIWCLRRIAWGLGKRTTILKSCIMFRGFLFTAWGVQYLENSSTQSQKRVHYSIFKWHRPEVWSGGALFDIWFN